MVTSYPRSLAVIQSYRNVVYKSRCLRPYTCKPGFKPCFYPSYASIQNMFLRQYLQSTMYSAHCHTRTCTYASIQIVLLCQDALQKIGFYTSHASTRVVLLHGSYFYTGHASIQVMLLYATLQYVNFQVMGSSRGGGGGVMGSSRG